MNNTETLSPDQIKSFLDAEQVLADLERRGWRLGLDRMDEYIDLLGLRGSLGPTPKFVHVTGTNGKGSVTCYVQHVLAAQGLNVGAFYSPYVFTSRERIQLGTEYITEEDFIDLVRRLVPVGEQLTKSEMGGPTEFETKTAMGFQYWADKGCDWVALEVGLGGKLDATNIVDPAVSVIVTISLDHTKILGETVEEIAEEKAGIIKAGRPVVVGNVPKSALRVIESRAKEMGSPLYVFGRDFNFSPDAHGGISVQLPDREITDLQPGMPGEYQHHNLAVALTALEVSGGLVDLDQARKSVMRARLPGRMQKLFWNGFELLLDGAHNPAGAKSLADSLVPFVESGQRMSVMASQVSGHDTVGVFRELRRLSDTIVVCPVDFFRTKLIDELVDAAKVAGFDQIISKENSTEALEAFRPTLDPLGLGVVCGSFYLLGELGKELGVTNS